MQRTELLLPDAKNCFLAQDLSFLICKVDLLQGPSIPKRMRGGVLFSPTLGTLLHSGISTPSKPTSFL